MKHTFEKVEFNRRHAHEVRRSVCPRLSGPLALVPQVPVEVGQTEVGAGAALSPDKGRGTGVRNRGTMFLGLIAQTFDRRTADVRARVGFFAARTRQLTR
jgi:hypothetical protein